VSYVEETLQIGAGPDEVWRLVGDPVAMTGLTAECVHMEWLGASSGPSVGARFRGRNRSGWRRWTTTCTIVRYVPGAEIAWDVAVGPLPVARWAYRVEPGEAEGTTDISERFDDHRGALLRAAGPLVRGTGDADARNRKNIRATLARIKEQAEA
jgi:Polyketide cyclase / dehydrase and lipid transport